MVWNLLHPPDLRRDAFMRLSPRTNRLQSPMSWSRSTLNNRSKSETHLPLQMTTSDEGYSSPVVCHNFHFPEKKDASTQTLPKKKGLFKGSTNQLMELGGKPQPAERPKTLRKLKNVYENVYHHNEQQTQQTPSQTSSVDKSLSILSPFDEQEEWAKISEIMASFGTGLVRESVFVSELEKEFQDKLCQAQSKLLKEESPKIATKVGHWLNNFDLLNYEHTFIDNGYDDLDFLNGVLDEQELRDIGISDEKHVRAILEHLEELPKTILDLQKYYLVNNNTDETSEMLDTWLDSLHLGLYKETFRRHLYTDMDRIKKIWEVELTAVLEILKSGHRRRILMSVNSPQKGGAGPEPRLEEINADLTQLQTNIQQLKEEIREKLPSAINSPSTIKAPSIPPNTTSNLAPGSTGTLRHSHKKNRPAPPPPVCVNGKTPTQPPPAPDLEIRNPSELLVGVPSTLTTQWRHRPEELVGGNITYVASYLGSTVVKELRGTESTQKSIQKLKKTTGKELSSTPDIILAISYRGVKFLNTSTQDPVCEHEIRNIHCACQDADDLTHFAYITKDHISQSHYCHVFCVQTMDQATEVILTLGQAFEVAYQMALRDQFTNSRGHGNGHTRSQSAIIANLVTMNNASNTQSSNHCRSLSVNEIKINGNIVKQSDSEHCENRAPIVANDDL